MVGRRRYHRRGALLTSTALRRSTKKFSARIIIKRINFLQRIFSISSACLMAMLMRSELIEPSNRTRSFSLRLTMTGENSSSVFDLERRGRWQRIEGGSM